MRENLPGVTEPDSPRPDEPEWEEPLEHLERLKRDYGLSWDQDGWDTVTTDDPTLGAVVFAPTDDVAPRLLLHRRMRYMEVGPWLTVIEDALWRHRHGDPSMFDQELDDGTLLMLLFDGADRPIEGPA